MTGDDPRDAGLAAYVRVFETLSDDRLATIDDVTCADVRFKDPFNDVTGRDGMRAVFAHMYRTVTAPRFSVLAAARDGDTGLLLWRLDGHLPKGPITITGMSALQICPDGLIAEHIDHWDAAEQAYGRVPVLGPVLRFIRRRAAADR